MSANPTIDTLRVEAEELRDRSAAFMADLDRFLRKLQTVAAERSCAVPEISVIITAVAEHFGVTPDQILGKNRFVSVVTPRHIAMSLAREITTFTIVELAEAFSRDHGTITHACQRVADLETVDPAIPAALAALRPIIRQRLETCDLPLWNTPTGGNPHLKTAKSA